MRLWWIPLLVACQTTKPTAAECKEYVQHAQTRAAIYVQTCREALKACKAELFACVDEQVDFD